jgi:hypothetical protein
MPFIMMPLLFGSFGSVEINGKSAQRISILLFFISAASMFFYPQWSKKIFNFNCKLLKILFNNKTLGCLHAKILFNFFFLLSSWLTLTTSLYSLYCIHLIVLVISYFPLFFFFIALCCFLSLLMVFVLIA